MEDYDDRYASGFDGSMSSWVFTYFQTHENVYSKYVQKFYVSHTLIIMEKEKSR